MKDIFDGKCIFNHSKIIKTNKGAYICGKTKLPQSLSLTGYNVIGDNCKIGEGVTLENCIVIENSVIKPLQKFSNCVIAPNSMNFNYSTKNDVKKHVVLL